MKMDKSESEVRNRRETRSKKARKMNKCHIKRKQANMHEQTQRKWKCKWKRKNKTSNRRKLKNNDKYMTDSDE